MKVLVVYLLFMVWFKGACLTTNIVYDLQLEYAKRPGISAESCEGNIIWNNQIVASLTPKDDNIHVLSLKVIIDPYRVNILQIQATGIPDGTGLTIDNVKLYKDDDVTKRNLVINGDFEDPPVPQADGTVILTSIKGWYIKDIQIGIGINYNPLWSSQIVEIDTYYNNVFSQAFSYISNSLVAVTNKVLAPPNANKEYILEFDWAIRPLSAPLDDFQAQVVVNNKLVATLCPDTNSMAINHTVIHVQLAPGVNSICIDAAGPTDDGGIGIVIDNIKLTTATNSTNIIVNGDFQFPVLPKLAYSLIKGGIRGWDSSSIELGDCNLYGNNWTSGQCVETASLTNQRLIQRVQVPS